MKWLMYFLIAFGTFATFAVYGTKDKKQKRTYLIITIAIWILVVLLANK